MENTIIVETKLTLQDYRKFRIFQQYHRRRWVIPMWVGLCVWVLLIWLYYLKVYEGYYSYPLWATAVLLAYFGFVFVMDSVNEKRYVRSAKHLFNSKTRYEFREEIIPVTSVSPDATGHSEVHYSAFDKVYETKDAFYLYFSLTQAYLIPKEQVGQAVEQLSALLRDKLGDKFAKRC